MLTRISVLCVCLLLPQTALADTIITWVGEGAVTGNYQMFPHQVVPPVGTPFSLTMTFDPTAAVPGRAVDPERLGRVDPLVSRSSGA